MEPGKCGARLRLVMFTIKIRLGCKQDILAQTVR